MKSDTRKNERKKSKLKGTRKNKGRRKNEMQEKPRRKE